MQIIDSSEALCKMLKESISDLFETDTYYTGVDAIERIHAFRPDILVLSTMLPGNDGFHILRTLQSAGFHTCVLMLTPIVTDYILEMATELNVSYMMCKPCNINALVSCICDMRDKLDGNKKRGNIDLATAELLLHLGFRTNLCGYRYLIAAISCLHREPEQSLTKEVYPAAGIICNCSWQQIDHGIRTAITDAYRNREKDVWNLYFPPAVNGTECKPTNSMFLTRMIKCLPVADTEG